VDKDSHYVTALRALKDDDRLRGLKKRTGTEAMSPIFAILSTLPQRGDLLAAGGLRLEPGDFVRH
jgi:hypothetical protein